MRTAARTRERSAWRPPQLLPSGTPTGRTARLRRRCLVRVLAFGTQLVRPTEVGIARYRPECWIRRAVLERLEELDVVRALFLTAFAVMARIRTVFAD